MNFDHLHLLLNHVPTVGFGIGLALYRPARALPWEPLLFFPSAVSVRRLGQPSRAAHERSPGLSPTPRVVLADGRPHGDGYGERS